MVVTTVVHAARNLTRHARFTAAAVATLGFGIGITTLVFTMVNSVLLRQLPFKNPEQLVWIWVTLTDRDRAFFSIPNFLDVRAQSKSFKDIALYTNFGANVTGTGEAERLQGVMITANVFELLGVDAALGRTLAASDGQPSAERAVVLRYDLWQKRFGSDRSVVGRTLELNGSRYRIVGVLPSQFTLPGAAEAEFAVPLVLETDPRRAERGTRFLRGFGRLNSGTTPEQARLELAAIFERLKTDYPDDNGKHTAPRLVPLRDEIVGTFGTLMWTLQAAVAGVLLIACSNLANMCLARSSTRRNEFAIRSAIGGSRFRVFAQLFTESLLLALCGGTLGLLIAGAGLNALIAASPADLPRAVEIALDARVVGFTFAVSLVTAVIFGVAPARYASRFDLIDELKRGRGNAGRPSEIRMRRALVAGEVALAVVLLILAGLFIRSFKSLQSVETGIQGRNVLLMRLSLVVSSDFGEFSRKFLPAVRELSGVDSAGLASTVPLSGLNNRTDFTIVGRAATLRTDVPGAQHRWVSVDYFRAMGIPIMQGRSFSEFDRAGSAGVAIIDQTLAGMFFPNEDPVGKHIRITDGPAARQAEIIGVVGNVKHFTLDEPPTPTLYSAIDQIHPGALAFVASGFRLIVRTHGEPAGYAQIVRDKLRSVDKDVPASAVATMDQFLDAAVSARRLNVRVLGFFSGAALILSALGLYAVVSYVVAQRKSEIGIRMALGASRHAVVGHVVSDGMKLAAAGVAIGIAVSFAITRAISASLFGVSPLDFATFVTAPILMGLVSLAAVLLAAKAATRVDPTSPLLS